MTTVRELIDKLNKFDPNLEVLVSDENYLCELTGPWVRTGKELTEYLGTYIDILSFEKYVVIEMDK